MKWGFVQESRHFRQEGGTGVAATLQLRSGAEPYPGFRLDRFLGRGAWGEVWRAVRSDGKEFALKFLPSDSQFAAVQEIRALQSIRQVKHPNLIQIDQVWCCSGYLVIAMELAEGSLLDLLDVYQQEFHSTIYHEHACFFLMQVAQVLDFLNTRQHTINGQCMALRHCDVKPSNILLKGRSVKLADFSLVAQATSSMWYHRRIGTLHYAAPEIFHGCLSDRTDQYALAVTYCHIRGGRLPFEDTPDNFARDYLRPVPDLSMLTVEEMPIVRRALSPTPQDRWPSCVDMMRRLTNCQAAVPCATR